MKRARRWLWVWLAMAATAAGQEPSAQFASAYERLDRFAAQAMQRERTPGMAIALTTRERLLRVSTYGFADIKTREPVAPETLFEIGSISKSFTAIALLQLAEEGRIDLRQPVSHYLPWFEVQTRFAPITIHHLLTHTAGIPRDRDDIPSSLYQAVALRERSTGYAPGIKFAYSNIGYQVLGYLLEQVTGQAHAEVIRQRILARLGMTSTEPAITHETRRRLAVGYAPFYDDRPDNSSYPPVEATWCEYGAGDGSIAAPPADLAAYVRMLLNRGAGPNGRILSEESFRLLTQRATRSGDAYYGYGIATREAHGHTLVSHGGGMIGYSSYILGDLEDGLGVVVFVNGFGNPARVAEYALELLRAAAHGQELPPVPPADAPTQVKNAADFAGVFAAPDGRKLTLVAEGEALFLLHKGRKIPLERRGTDAFVAVDPDFALFPLEFRRAKASEEKKQGEVIELFHGGDWYAGERYQGTHAFQVPQEWVAYAGHYRSYSPWVSNFRIFLRKDRLAIAFRGGTAQPLMPLGPGLFQVGEEETAERLRLDTVVNGKALRANLSGVDCYRVFTP